MCERSKQRGRGCGKTRNQAKDGPLSSRSVCDVGTAAADVRIQPGAEPSPCWLKSKRSSQVCGEATRLTEGSFCREGGNRADGSPVALNQARPHPASRTAVEVRHRRFEASLLMSLLFLAVNPQSGGSCVHSDTFRSSFNDGASVTRELVPEGFWRSFQALTKKKEANKLMSQKTDDLTSPGNH